MAETKPEFELLLIEDNQGDSILVQEAIRELKTPIFFEWVDSGDKALKRLLNPAKKLPDLVMLDVNLPDMTGFELLQVVQSDPRLKNLRIIMVSGSDAVTDIEKAFSQSVFGYIVKPAFVEEFVRLLHTHLESLVTKSPTLASSH